MKSIVSLLAVAPNRASAANWASELEKNGFAHHSADEVKKALSVSFARSACGTPLTESQESLGPIPVPGLPEGDSFGTPGSESFAIPSHPMGPPSYAGSSRQERYF
jgi:hypothetical protein